MVASCFRVSPVWLLRRPNLSQAGRYCLQVLALALFIFPTVLLGFMDWQHYYQGAWLLPIIVNPASRFPLSVLLSIGVIPSRYRPGRIEGPSRLFMSIPLLLTVGDLVYFGGRLVFGGRAPAAAPANQARQRLFETNSSSLSH